MAAIRPLGAEYYAYGSWYKKGKGGRMYRHSSDQWVVSTLSESKVRNADRVTKKRKEIMR